MTRRTIAAPTRLKKWTKFFAKISPRNPPGRSSCLWKWRGLNQRPKNAERANKITNHPINLRTGYFHSQRRTKLKAKTPRTSGIKKDENPHPWNNRLATYEPAIPLQLAV